MGEWLWLIRLGLQYLIWFSVPYVYAVVTDWPWHAALSSLAGLLGYVSTWIICHELWQRSWGELPSRRVARFIGLLSWSALIFFALLAHYTRDFWPLVQVTR